jgi:hypothetical protein
VCVCVCVRAAQGRRCLGSVLHSRLPCAMRCNARVQYMLHTQATGTTLIFGHLRDVLQFHQILMDGVCACGCEGVRWYGRNTVRVFRGRGRHRGGYTHGISSHANDRCVCVCVCVCVVGVCVCITNNTKEDR